MTSPNGPLRVGIGGPVGAGKTTLTEQLCRALRDEFSVAVITNDIYTREDAEYLMRVQALPLDRIRGVETGGCPHTANREDASINLAAVADLTLAFPDLYYVGVDPALLESDARTARGARPFVMASLKAGRGVAQVVDFLRRDGGLQASGAVGKARSPNHGVRH